MAPSLIFVLLAIAAARAAIDTPKDVVRFVKSNCVSIGAVAQETCASCERACRSVLELGKFCEDFCKGGRTAPCDILGKFQPGDAARYNDTAEGYCKTSEFADVCRILQSLRDAALLLESDNPCITSIAASAERDESSEDEDICAKLLKDSKDLTLCHPSDAANARDNMEKNTANTRDNTANTKGEAPRVNVPGHVPLRPLRGGLRGRTGGFLRRRREVQANAPVAGIQTVRSCEDDRGMCKTSCDEGTEVRTFQECKQPGMQCCYQMLGNSLLQDLRENRIPEIDITIPVNHLFREARNNVCGGTCSSTCGEEEQEVAHHTCSGEGQTCCYKVFHCYMNGGECKAECTDGTEVMSGFHHCESGTCCLKRFL